MQAGHQRGLAGGGLLHQQLHGGQRQGWVQRGDGLVRQNQFRPLVQHAGNAHALQLAAGELVAAGEQLVIQLHTGQRFARAGNVLRVGQRRQRLPQRPLAQLARQHGGNHALAQRNGRGLVHGANAGAQGFQSAGCRLGGRSLAQHLHAARGGQVGGGNGAEQTGFACARRADERNALALRGGQGNMGQGVKAVAVGQAHIVQHEAHETNTLKMIASSAH